MHASSVTSFLRVLALMGLVAAGGCMRGSAGQPAAAELYESCASCHGFDGQGNAAIGAPRIAGLPAWYVASQVTRFQSGLRGKHPDDAEGLRMRAMAKQMMTDAEIAAVASHIATFPSVKNAPTLPHSDPAAGAQAFTLCIGCHGPEGKGNEQVKAAPLAGMDDWYVALQLRKFRSGVRGKAEGDTVGPVMQAMSMAIQPETIDDLAAYVHNLQK
jgi:cytochrome c oxidase subunit II